MTIEEEVQKRRTFAIISHPDAGKTTLTEKLLLYGGAIHIAGQVSARKRQRQATSDWMALERERGISITSTVLQFPYNGYTVNLLDTPGHQDFGEDTYRTLLAADSAVMLIDAAKGVEPQTKKLFAICRDRGIPLFTFMNKLDRPSRDPLELLDELESVLGIGAFPMNWPLGNGDGFQRRLRSPHAHGALLRARRARRDTRRGQRLADVRRPAAWNDCRGIRLRPVPGRNRTARRCGRALRPGRDAARRSDPGLLRKRGDELRSSALPRRVRAMAPSPAPRAGVEPTDAAFTGFVFKIQANMDPRHRDRVAFVRVCSGEFARDMTVRNARTGATLRLSRAMRLFADDRESLETAYAGDVVGLANPGAFAIGDTIYEGTGRALPAYSVLCPGTFRVGAEYRRIGLQIIR